jgi:phosphatidylserine/phosphatidylglycerophosphate/cardiolipin synthase-like enzyme
MIVDDVFLTHGSANINTRSMEVDSELNICHEHNGVTAPLRRRLWDMHTGGMGAQDDPIDAFEEWGKIIDRNEGNQTTGQAPCASLVGFMRTSPKRTRLD